MRDKYMEGAIPSEVVENEVSHNLIHPAVADAEPAEEVKETDRVERLYPCVDIKHPFTEEGEPACLSKACPKNKDCKVCCKDWSKG